jgi:hypothetical protein
MKTNKTIRPTRQTRPAPLRPQAPRPQPREQEPERPNDFFTLCFYPGMDAIEFALPKYPTAV